MKKINTFFTICFAVLLLSMGSCSGDSDNSLNPGPTGPINTGELKLFAIDTAKVKTINSLGGNEQTIVNKSVNSSSYIGDFCISPDGTKFIYENHQQSNSGGNMIVTREIRKANIDGSGDVKIYEVTQNQTEIQKIKYCNDGKIMFYTSSYQSGAMASSAYLMNEDGSGIQTIPYVGVFEDVTSDRGYYLRSSSTGVQIFDADADNGAPGLYHTETLPAGQSGGEGVFTNDGKYVVIPYQENTTIKARIIDMTTKTSTTMTLISALGTGWISYHLEMASDSKRGVITITGADYNKSKTYIFDVKTGMVNAPFENNDENIFSVYVW